MITALFVPPALSQTPEPAAPVVSDEVFRRDYLSHMCRTDDIGDWGEDMLPWAAQSAMLGCRLYNWGLSAWETEDLTASSPVWNRAGTIISKARAVPGGPRRFILTLAEVLRATHKLDRGEGPYDAITSKTCMVNGRPGDEKYLFYYYYRTALAVRDGTAVTCTPPPTAPPAGGCACLCGNIQHYCPTPNEKKGSVPDVTKPATQTWWARIAQSGCAVGFTDFNFSSGFWTGAAAPDHTPFATLMQTIRAGRCGAGARYGIEDTPRRPAETFFKRVSLIKRIDKCTTSACYQENDCYEVGDPAVVGDLCIPRERFHYENNQKGAPYIFVELDLDEAKVFLIAPPGVRRRFIRHSLLSAKKSQEEPWGQTTPAFFEVPVVLEQGDLNWQPVAGGWVAYWSYNGKDNPVCPLWSNGNLTPAVFKVKGFVDAWTCGYDDSVKF